jgi:hypothetical protein
VLLPPQPLRQLGEVRRHAAGVVAGHCGALRNVDYVSPDTSRSPQSGANSDRQRGNTTMKKIIVLAIVALALLGGTAADVILDTQAVMADGGCSQVLTALWSLPLR